MVFMFKFRINMHIFLKQLFGFSRTPLLTIKPDG